MCTATGFERVTVSLKHMSAESQVGDKKKKEDAECHV